MVFNTIQIKLPCHFFCLKFIFQDFTLREQKFEGFWGVEGIFLWPLLGWNGLMALKDLQSYPS